MLLTLQQFKQAFPSCKESDIWYSTFSAELKSSTINTKLRLAHFLSQCAHESSYFNVLTENLNYSRDGLLKIFPKYFTPATAADYARKPQKIASRVYANRMENGPESSGDGWKYRGRGIIQLTGKSNYTRCSQALYKNLMLIENPDLLLDKSVAVRAAIWFWETNSLNQLADADNIIGVTKRINGGTIGLAHRTQVLDQIKRFL